MSSSHRWRRLTWDDRSSVVEPFKECVIRQYDISESVVAMEFIVDYNNVTKLVSDGYIYTKKRTCKFTEAWVCSARRGWKCKGQLITTRQRTVIKSHIPHSHDPDPHALEAIKIRNEVARVTRATGRGCKPTTIIDGVRKDFSAPQMVAAGKIFLTRFITREKSTQPLFLLHTKNKIVAFNNSSCSIWTYTKNCWEFVVLTMRICCFNNS